MIRWLGAVIVVGACGFCGFSLAYSYGNLEKCLRQLYNAMEIMCCQMEYRLTPLPELCQILTSACTGEIGQVFEDLETELRQEDAEDISVSMANALAKNQQLPEACVKSLRRLARTLGQADVQTQIRGITLEMEQLKACLEQVARERPGRVKSYRALGFSCGVALALMLL